MYLGNAWSDINSRFNEQFTLSSYIWTKYIFETYPVDPGQDQTECGVRCELSGSHCDFFTVASGKCYLGRYAYYPEGTVSDSSVPTTYHKTGTVFVVLVVVIYPNVTLQTNVFETLYMIHTLKAIQKSQMRKYVVLPVIFFLKFCRFLKLGLSN